MNSGKSLAKLWNVIINPTTLKGTSIKSWEKIATLLIYEGYEFVEWHTKHKNNAIRITENLLHDGIRQIMVIGGDGTLNEVVNGIMRSGISPEEVVLFLIPSGTGNDWAKSHGIKRNAKLILSMLYNENIVMHDVGLVRSIRNTQTNSRYFINIAGFGFDASVIKRVQESRKYKVGNGLIYIKNLLITLLSHKSVDCRIEIDNEIIEKFTFSIAVGICKYNGNGMMQVPMAKFNDGIFDIILIEQMSILQVIFQIPNLFKGKHINHPKVHHYQGENISILPMGRFYGEVEGELLDEGVYEIRNCKEKAGVVVVGREKVTGDR